MGNRSTRPEVNEIGPDHSTPEKELKDFDDTRGGVRGLVENRVTKVPRIFIHPPDDVINEGMMSTTYKEKCMVPVIDLKGIMNMERDGTARKEILINQVQNAAEKWGVFQVVNHGIAAEMLDEMLERVRWFNEQPRQWRSKFYTRDGTKKVVYNSFYDKHRKALYWRDTISFMAAPKFPNPSEMPIQFRNILMDYSKHVMNLGKALLQLLSEALGLEKEHLNNMGCLEVLYVSCHYYPPCPQPELTIGTPKHSDRDCLTILQQDQVGGLQFLHQGQWIDISSIVGGLVIIVGDFLQVMSNGKFKSVEHRALASHRGPRTSVVSFFTRRSELRVRRQSSISQFVAINKYI